MISINQLSVLYSFKTGQRPSCQTRSICFLLLMTLWKSSFLCSRYFYPNGLEVTALGHENFSSAFKSNTCIIVCCDFEVLQWCCVSLGCTVWWASCLKCTCSNSKVKPGLTVKIHRMPAFWLLLDELLHHLQNTGQLLWEELILNETSFQGVPFNRQKHSVA